jgi:sarcosine oxidase subunit alpha
LQGWPIDRSRTIRFTFAGGPSSDHPRRYAGLALLAHGEHMVARSFKYHRPRGILGAGSEDPAGIVQLDGSGGRSDPNTRVTEQEIYDGLSARPQNCWPTLKFDIGAVCRPACRPFCRPASTTRRSRARSATG